MRPPQCLWKLVALAFVLSASGTWAEESGTGTSLLDEGLWWLPGDTETLTVARSFKLEKIEESSEFTGISLGNLLRTEFFVDLDESVDIASVEGRRVSIALKGQRNFDTVSSFGSLRSESCAIVCFEEDLGAAWEKLEASLGANAPNVRRIQGQTVFQLPSTTAMEPWVKPKPWQGLFVARPTPRVLLIATSNKYLEEVLRRMSAKPRERALPPELPEWKHVDRAAAMWTIRHIPKAAPRTYFDGLTIAWRPGKISIAYIEIKPEAENAIRRAWDPLQSVKRLKRDWPEGTEFPYNLDAVKPRPSFTLKDSVVIVTLENAALVTKGNQNTELSAEAEFAVFHYVLMLYLIGGDDGAFFGG
jgi:hypothetical protein